ncbi:hypothetical protein [Methylosinus sp. Sm6]|uniref:hypothetical protein n=1 Tax=Methylosinus sp. Sm6 TaxID=2866948 RepID=UPI001C993486|nr:hypothetical protein [Methylosinus sp. Sm6]MBY6241166.1 hypothetical protein [Methylosinus sp. Sm6]
MNKTILTAGLLAIALAGSTLSADARPWRHHHHHGPGAGVVAAGALGALALGAAIEDSDCYIAHRPVTDHWGNVLYLRDVTVCD